MNDTRRGYTKALLATTFTLLETTGASALGQQAESTPPPDEEIASLVRDLSDPSYQTRTAATRRLCTIGMRASELLRKAATSEDVEAALRAKVLLITFDRLLFAGVDVTLTFSRTKVAWDEPTDLLITMANGSGYPARIPFQIDDAEGLGANEDVQQVGTMLDVADWLHVRSPNGHTIQLRVDDVTADSRVADAVDERASGGSFGVLPAGAQVTVTARAFNRGWARYPLLDRGEYTVMLEYLPSWEDEALARERVGRVVSNRAVITVTNGAPPAVSRGHTEASVALERDGTWLTATLTNTTDQPMFVNQNFGRAAPFARGLWVYMRDEVVHEIALGPPRQTGWGSFDEESLVVVPPGHGTELTRVQIGELRNRLETLGADLDGNQWTVRFVYSNLCDRQWQSRQEQAMKDRKDVPRMLRVPLPRRLLSAHHVSNQLIAPTVD